MRPSWFLLLASACAGARPPLDPSPATNPGADLDTVHGVKVPDPYRWLEDEKAPAVVEWMKAHDARARAYLDALPRREALSARYRALQYVDEVGVPLKRGARLFLRRRAADAEQSVYVVREGEVERVLLDPAKLAKDGPVSLGVTEPSNDGRWLAYSLRPNNADEATLYVMDVNSGETSAVDVIPGAKYAEPSWTADGGGFYYTWLPTDPSIPVAERPGYAEARFHRLGEDPSKDRVVRARSNDPTSFIDARVSDDGEWLFFNVWHGWGENELFVRRVEAPGHPPEGFDGQTGWSSISQGKKALFFVSAHEGTFYVHTNDEAPRWKVYAVDPERLDRGQWRTVVEEDAQAVLQTVSIVGGRLALGYLRNAASELELRDLDGTKRSAVPLPTIGSASALIGSAKEDLAYFSFSSFTYPAEVHEVAIGTGTARLWERAKVSLDSAAFEVSQVWYASKDGTKVSMFVVSKKGLARTGDTPTLLYGYGGFNVVMSPAWNPLLIPWLELGGIYALPNLRGGGEYGEAWHVDGMLTKKQNVFDDFIAAGEFLVREGYTRSARLGIYGRSNGGLLVGAAMTQRPDLFRTVLCGVPLLDMVRYHLFGSGKTWIPEYGSAEDPEQFKAILAYSPYARVQKGTAYPSLLMLSTDHDDRVDPLHARKFVAAVADASTSEAPAILSIESNAGHAGADQRTAAVKKNVDIVSFLAEQLGLD